MPKQKWFQVHAKKRANSKYVIVKNQCRLTLTLISGGRGSQRTAGSPSRNRLPEMSWCEAEAPPLRQDGWMSCWKKRQKKWSSRGALSAMQKALRAVGRGGEEEEEEERDRSTEGEQTSSIDDKLCWKPPIEHVGKKGNHPNRLHIANTS